MNKPTKSLPATLSKKEVCSGFNISRKLFAQFAKAALMHQHVQDFESRKVLSLAEWEPFFKVHGIPHLQ